MEERFTFRHVHEITGTFVIIILLGLVATVVWTSHSKHWFRSNVTLQINLPDAGAAGIRQGSEVYFLGTLVGSVSDVTVDTAGHMEAQANIRKDYFRFVRADSSAVVKKKFGVAGDSFFEISRGVGAPLPEINASIVCNEQFQSALESAIEEIRREALAVLKKSSAGLDTWTTLGSNLLTTREHMDQIFERVNMITADVQQGKGTAGVLLTDSVIADELKNVMVNAHHSMNELQVTIKNLQNASGHIQAASTNLPAISEALRHESGDLPGLVLETQTTMRELERLIEAMQRHWLLRKYVNPTNPPPMRPPEPKERTSKLPVRKPWSPSNSTK